MKHDFDKFVEINNRMLTPLNNTVIDLVFHCARQNDYYDDPDKFEELVGGFNYLEGKWLVAAYLNSMGYKSRKKWVKA